MSRKITVKFSDSRLVLKPVRYACATLNGVRSRLLFVVKQVTQVPVKWLDTPEDVEVRNEFVEAQELAAEEQYLEDCSAYRASQVMAEGVR